MSEHGSNNDLANEGLDAATRYVADALGRIGAREEELRGQLQLVAEERKRLTVALRALAPEHALVQQAPKARRPGKGRTARPETMRMVWGRITANGEAFTIPGLAKSLGLNNDDSVRRAVYMLRDHEALRAAGRASPSGDGPHGQPAMQFRVLDREAGDAFVAALDG